MFSLIGKQAKVLRLSFSAASKLNVVGIASCPQPPQILGSETFEDGHGTKQLKKPKEIPFQIKAANSVSLVGHVDSPVQRFFTSDGKYATWAFISQISYRCSSPFLRIPLIFKGDLAYVAQNHLTQGNRIFVCGEVTAEDFFTKAAVEISTRQILVHTLNLVK